MWPKQILLSLRPTIFVFILTSASVVFSQSSSFTYQGRLNDGGTPANGNYDLEFRLFDVQSGGTALATQQQLNVAASAGVFTATLDFGASFTGGQRFLEIAVRSPGGSTFTTLNPRQPITSTPYAIRSLNASAADTATNATQLGGVAASNYVQTNDTRLTDARSPLPGSTNYIQNQGSGPQTSSNFNISGSGTATLFRVSDGYYLGNNYLLRTSGCTPICGYPWSNTFAGIFSGRSTVPAQGGVSNSFFGNFAGEGNTNGARNSFFGQLAGVGNTLGSDNSYFGFDSGRGIQGIANSFFGSGSAQLGNGAASYNSSLGTYSARSLIVGSHNTLIGYSSGINITSGNSNTFLGTRGQSATVENLNTLVGSEADVTAGISNATAIGAYAKVSSSNSLVLGSIKDVNSATTDTNVGIGTTSPATRLHVVGNGLFTGNLMVGGTLNVTLPATLSTLAADAGSISGSLQIGSTSTLARVSVTDRNGLGVKGIVTSPSTVFGDSYVGRTALWGTSTTDVGVFGTSDQYAGVAGSSNSHFGVWGRANVGYGGSFDSNSGTGLYAHSTSGYGLWARSEQTHAMYAEGSVRFTRWLVLDELRPGINAVSVCRNSSNELSFCSSSLRYKENVGRFASGLDLVRKLRPITFDWKRDGIHDLGLAAEDVEKIEPLLVTYNQDGQVEGVKYERIGVVLINAVKEQQAQIQKQQEQLEEQQKQIAALKNLLCRSHRRTRMCR